MLDTSVGAFAPPSSLTKPETNSLEESLEDNSKANTQT